MITITPYIPEGIDLYAPHIEIDKNGGVLNPIKLRASLSVYGGSTYNIFNITGKGIIIYLSMEVLYTGYVDVIVDGVKHRFQNGVNGVSHGTHTFMVGEPTSSNYPGCIKFESSFELVLYTGSTSGGVSYTLIFLKG